MLFAIERIYLNTQLHIIPLSMQRFYTANTEHFLKLLIHKENRQNVDTHFIKLNNVEICEQENTGNTWKTIQLGIISEAYGLFALNLLKSTSIKIENKDCLVTFSFVSLHTQVSRANNSQFDVKLKPHKKEDIAVLRRQKITF